MYVALAIICGYVSWSRVVIDDTGTVWTNQDSVDSMVAMRADAPTGLAQWTHMRSRLLVPVLIVGAKDYLGIPYNVTHDATRLMFIITAVLLFHWHLRTWFAPIEAVAGTLFVLATVTITFNNWFPVPTDFPELIGMTACTALLVRQRWIMMLMALFVYTLNRETAVVFSCVALAWLYDGGKSLARLLAVVALILATWAVAYELARFASNVGPGSFLQLSDTPGESGQGLIAQVVEFFEGIWVRRLASVLALISNPHPYNVNWSPALVFNIFWVLPAIMWRTVPLPLRRLYAGGLLAGVPIFLLGGVLNETGRILIPLYPLLLPAGMYAFSRHVINPYPDHAVERS